MYDPFETEREFGVDAFYIVTAADWDRDGDSLYVTGMPLGSAHFGIARVSLDGETELIHASKDTWLGKPASSPDGRWLAVTGSQQTCDAWLLEGF